MSTEPAGRSRVEGQNQPVGLRRSTPSATSSSSTAAAGGATEHVAHVVLGQRQLGRGADELRAQHVGVGRVEHAPLHRRAEQRVRVVHEVGVQGVVAGHEHHERLVARPAGASGLLPERRPRAREPGHHHRVEPGDVHAELERVRRRHAQQLAPDAALPPAPAAPRAGSRPRYAATRDARPGSTSASTRARVSAVSSAPRRERTNASVRAPSTTRSASIRAVSAPADRRTGAPFSPVTSASSGGSHNATVRPAAGEPSSVTAATSRPVSREADAAGSDTVADASTNVGCEP